MTNVPAPADTGPDQSPLAQLLRPLRTPEESRLFTAAKLRELASRMLVLQEQCLFAFHRSHDGPYPPHRALKVFFEWWKEAAFYLRQAGEVVPAMPEALPTEITFCNSVNALEQCVRAAADRITPPVGSRQVKGEKPSGETATGTQPANTNAPPVGTEQDLGKNPKSDDEPDGPFDLDGFRFRGVAVRFGKAGKQYDLVLALWDTEKKSPAAPRLVQDVIEEVYGTDSEPTDDTFRQLLTDTRARFEKDNCPLKIRHMKGKVQLIPV